MSTLSTDELEEWLERSHRKWDLALDIAESNDQPPASELARRAREIAVYNLLLGNTDEAAEWFAEAVDWFRERWDQLRGEINEPQMAMWALFTAVLSQDDDLIEQTAVDVVEEGIEHRSPEYYVHLDDCLANLVRGNDEAAVEAADALISLEPEAPEEVGSYPGLGGACHAIVDGDAAGLDTALASTLDRHEELEKKRAESVDHILVCIPATVFLLVARNRGFVIEDSEAFQSENVPSTIFE